jgi:hypothetical protein
MAAPMRINYYSPFTIYHLPQRKEEHDRAPRFCKTMKSEPELLSAWRLDVDVDFLCAAAAKQSSSECKHNHQDDDHEDYQNCDNPGAAATTITIVSHKPIPPV